MPERPLCSVIIPAYNAGEYISGAIDSALAQTYGHVEVVVVDDGSTDDTDAHLSRYAGKIVYERQANRGTSAARNRALELARGDFIALLDADDYWAPERLERIIGLLSSKPEVGFASSDAYIVRNGEPTSETFYRRNKLPKAWTTDQARLIVQHNFFFGSAVIRRALFDKHGTFDETLRAGEEDWELWIRFLTRGEQFDLVLEPLAYYRRRPGTLSAVPLDVRGKKSAFIEYILRQPEVRRVPGSTGLLSYVRGVESLARGDAREAKGHFRTALEDPELPPLRRWKARVAASAPFLGTSLFRAWRAIRRRV